ncbi:RNA polymerase sigma factor [Georgenia alba]|uniref:RNA polymerase sigma factor n=1 Tax=Georgenia alba TaxID=2233858 RepID=A0ABW2Q879_9MICO
MDVHLEDLLRREAPQVLGALVRRFGRFDVAEDAVQEALLAASRQWPEDGVPDNPRTWLIRVGYRRMVDLLRSEQARHRREIEVGVAEVLRPATPAAQSDDSLTLLMLCCHPALSEVSRVALTLRAVGGLTTAEIAHAYGVTETTMGTRISRAKQTLQRAGARFTPPDDDERTERLSAVRAVLYLIYNEGYTASAGETLGRLDLADEAIRLTRLLHRSSPDPESTGLLALALLTDSRRDARTGADQQLVPLSEQDRSVWDRGRIAEGTALIDSVWGRSEPGPYQVQAAIASVHAQARTPEETDWAQIAALYLVLEQQTPTGLVRLGRVVAVAHAYGAVDALPVLDELDQRHRLTKDPLTKQRTHAVRAHLLEMVGDTRGAAQSYRTAADLTGNAVERAYLMRRASRL